MHIQSGIYLKFGFWVYFEDISAMAEDFPELDHDGWYVMHRFGHNGPFSSLAEAEEVLSEFDNELIDECWDDALPEEIE